MADQTAVNAKHATLTGAAVDKITLTGRPAKVDVLNRGAAGSADLYVTVGNGTSEPADPTAAGDNTEIVAPGGFVTLDVPTSVPGSSAVVKVIGNGNAYSVIGVR